jgi:exodeoxyribonuclease-5
VTVDLIDIDILTLPIDFSGLSEQQLGACRKFWRYLCTPIGQWRDPTGQIRNYFRLDGPAGSGKTYIAQVMARMAVVYGGYVMYAAYTGKASEVLRSKGCNGAATIHSTIYVPLGDEDSWDYDRMVAELHGLRQVFKNEPTPQMVQLEKDIQNARMSFDKPQFGLNYESMLWSAKLFAIDEHSMVDDVIGNHVLAFGVRILALGDTFQLPPVEGEGFFMRGLPDYELTEIHRQAKGSPVLYLANVARESRSLPFGEFENEIDPSVLPSVVKTTATIAELSEADQVLCGKNITRHELNQKIRAYRGFQGDIPEPGEKLICLRNDKDTGARNGTLWTVIGVQGVRQTFNGAVVSMTLESEDGRTIRVSAWKECFNGGDMKGVPYRTRSMYQEFTYGYAITVHKSQGSQWDYVALVDESRVFREEEHRHRYTGLTRAAKRVLVVRGAQG